MSGNRKQRREAATRRAMSDLARTMNEGAALWDDITPEGRRNLEHRAANGSETARLLLGMPALLQDVADQAREAGPCG